ncbi:MAG: hypothetical protein ACREBG_13245 [Pyrinomonadaceae bacterium]
MFNQKIKAFALLAALTLILMSLSGARDVHSATQTSAQLFFLSDPFQIHSSANLITENSVGPVRLGMTVTQARKALPGFTLSRTSDGEGLALIAVKRGGKTLMTLYAGEANPDARVNERAVIEFVEAWDVGYRTAAGVHTTMPLRDVERKYGKLEEIILSEIEQREFATFANQPAGISLRVMNENGLAGVYSDGQRKATRFAPSSYVFSISIKRSPARTPRFSSAYTNLRTQCKNPDRGSDQGQHASLFCRGVGNYRIHIFDSAMALHINAETLDRQASIPLAEQNLTYDRQRRRIEWRLANGNPFAVILRVFKYSGKGKYPLQEKPTGDVLLVKGLAGYEHIGDEVDVRTTSNPNAKARELADKAYSRQ